MYFPRLTLYAEIGFGILVDVEVYVVLKPTNWLPTVLNLHIFSYLSVLHFHVYFFLSSSRVWFGGLGYTHSVQNLKKFNIFWNL